MCGLCRELMLVTVMPVLRVSTAARSLPLFAWGALLVTAQKDPLSEGPSLERIESVLQGNIFMLEAVKGLNHMRKTRS